MYIVQWRGYYKQYLKSLYLFLFINYLHEFDHILHFFLRPLFLSIPCEIFTKFILGGVSYCTFL